MSVPTSLRPATDDDHDVLRRIYAETRDDVAALLDWTDAQKEAFLTMQFEAQHRDYHERFAGARFDLIVSGDEVVGRLYVDRREDEIRILDIALLRAWRRRGIGSHWMRSLLDEASERGVPVRIHVAQDNPDARALHDSLGFVEIGEVGAYWFMEWSPPGDDHS